MPLLAARSHRPAVRVAFALLLAALACAGAAALRPAGARAASSSLSTQIANQLARAGGASGAFVLDTTSGRALATVRADTARIPASNEKLFTTATALLRFGAATSLATTIYGSGQVDDAGVWHGDLYLRGAGDPTFGSASFVRSAYGAGADVSSLATRLAASGITSVTGAIYGDESWFDTRRGGPASGYRVDYDIGGPLSGLDFNRGLANEKGTALQTKPATFAAQQLAAALKTARVRVSSRIGERRAPAGAQPLVSVDSPTMATLVKLTLVPSDNFFAEILLKDLGAKYGAGGSTAAGAAVVRSTLASRFGVSPTVLDGSGLSRGDATTPRQVVTLLDGMRDQAGFRSGFAVAGRTGTLAARMRRTSAQDRCVGKTGTLSNVSALSGYCTTANGHLLAYSLLQNSVSPTAAHTVQDRIAIALARLAPSGPPRATPTGGAGAVRATR
ncbi:MAG: D-alanyl-D-alaninecarboxypeptidase/D-alanyl-D-alanine-endopeptidase [Conexibacter sp.]|nr:D-alanyl-D-alaninecarboxypeptidase/D-alanyl-D-alanine-endopeptidase [Conexibacter sp.]